MNEYEIEERSSGFWITDGMNPDGPFDTLEEAQQAIEELKN